MPYLELGEERRELTPGETIVGSGAQSTWRVQGHDLAAKHFTVRVAEDGRTMVRPSSAQNVVVINGRQATVQSTPLEHGDVVAAGGARFYYLQNDAPVERRESGGAPHAYLIDQGERSAYLLARRSISIGRDSASTIFIGDPHVSRFHADVRSEAGVHVIYGMGSAGTTLNGKRLGAPHVLEEGDRIEIGGTELMFTQQPLPAGTRVIQSSDDVDEEAARRATTTHAIPEADTGPRGRYKETSGKRSGGLIVIMLILAAAVAAALYLL